MGVASSSFVVLTCYIEPDTEVGGFVTRCPSLGVASQGETLKEAEANIREAVGLYLQAIDEDGDLEEILGERDRKAISLF